jgi:predicted hydrocarbon binding protein
LAGERDAALHGLIFTAFRQYSWTRLPEAAASIWDGMPNYVMTEAYPDSSFRDLVQRAAETTGHEPDEILREFGRFTGFWVFRVMRPDYYDESETTRRFLLDVERRIHETIRSTTVGATPPHLTVAPIGDEGVSISYTSERRLCALLEGLVAGVAEYYGEHFRIEQPVCMHRGDPACSFVVTPE